MVLLDWPQLVTRAAVLRDHTSPTGLRNGAAFSKRWRRLTSFARGALPIIPVTEMLH